MNRRARLIRTALVASALLPAVTVVVPAQAQGTCESGGRLSGTLRPSAARAAAGLAEVRVVATWDPGAAADGSAQHRQVSVRTDAVGAFLFCGLPLEREVVVRALAPGGRTQVRRVQLPASGEAEPLVIAVDASQAAVATLVGSVVRVDSLRHIPIAGVEVAIQALNRSVRTDSAGHFRLADIPPGTHRVIARQVGRGSVAEEIAFAPNDEVEWHVPLLRLTTLSDVNIVAKELDPQLLEFEEHRKMGLGKFLTREELAKVEGLRTASVVRPLTGVRIVGGGHYAFVNSRRHVTSLGSAECAKDRATPGSPIYVPDLSEKRRGIQCACYSQVYMDGTLMNPGTPTEPYDINQIPVTSIESVEWYSSPAQVPAKYARLNSSCGVLVIHRRRPGG